MSGKHIVPDQRYPHLGTAELGAVDWFAHDMKRKLEDNHNKGDRETWLNEHSDWLLERTSEELEELKSAIGVALSIVRMRELGMNTNEDAYMASLQHIVDEAADVGNFAMMIADKTRYYLRMIEERRAKWPPNG